MIQNRQIAKTMNICLHFHLNFRFQAIEQFCNECNLILLDILYILLRVLISNEYEARDLTNSNLYFE